MSVYALDTNILSYLLRGDSGLMARIQTEEKSGNRIVIVPIVYYEVARGLLANPAPKKRAAFLRLCELFGVKDLDKRTLDTAANIYAQQRKIGRPVEDSDLLIAASCLTHDYVLVTNNMKHFEVIDGLRVVNWVSE